MATTVARPAAIAVETDTPMMVPADAAPAAPVTPAAPVAPAAEPDALLVATVAASPPSATAATPSLDVVDPVAGSSANTPLAEYGLAMSAIAVKQLKYFLSIVESCGNKTFTCASV
jgi:hypothetical protein